ncbi:hypothetical protein SK128_026873, partial [Halocaridina rubra]
DNGASYEKERNDLVRRNTFCVTVPIWGVDTDGLELGIKAGESYEQGQDPLVGGSCRGQMKALGRLKGALHLLLLTVFITYSCLFTLSYLNQFRPEALPAPIPALPLDSTWINNDAIKKDGRPGMSLSQGDIFTYGGNSLQKEALLEKFDDGGNIRLISQLEGSLRGNLEDETVENEADNGKKNGEKNKENFSKKNKKKENVWPIVLEPSDGAFLYEINLSEYSKESPSK